MSGIQQLLLGGSPAGYQIERSLRFNSADSAYLNRTPASAGNRKTWTWSGWVKRSRIDSGTTTYTIFSNYSGNSDTNYFTVYFYQDAIRITGFTTTWRITTQLFRDPSSWYHIVVAVDTTQATANNRIRLYVNGAEVTAFSTTNNPSQNADLGMNQAAATYIGADVYTGPTAYFNGYLTEINFIDGQALTPSDFGETDSATGVWKPKKFSGTYGTNGFYLNFSDNSNTTSTTLGKDYSGNGNNWTPNNFSVTAGAGNDSLVDTPTSYGTDTGVGGEVRGNYCTWNSADNLNSVTLSNGNLQVTGNGTTARGIRGTLSLGGSTPFYFEYTNTTNFNINYPMVGICAIDEKLGTGANDSATGPGKVIVLYPNGANWGAYSNGSLVTSGTATAYSTNGSIVMFAWDPSTGKFWMGVGGTWHNSGNPAAGTNPTGTISSFIGLNMTPTVSTYSTSDGFLNCGQRPFAYTAPSGFKALCTQNLPTPTIGATSTTQANDYFDATLYTGNNQIQQSIVNAGGFQPDLVWIKVRNRSDNHVLTNSVVGAGKNLYSNNTLAENTNATVVTAFNSNGFSLGTDTLGAVNTGTDTFVAWQWKANGAGSSNTAGTITSTVSANTTAGFSIVTYTGNGTNPSTVGHGLGVAPSFIIVKNRDSAAYDWNCYHISLGNTQYIALNTTLAAASAVSLWNNTTPTSNVFTINHAAVNNNTNKYVAYCFAAIAGYSAFGSYTGNGSSDGPFVYTGFRPRYVMVKRTNSTGNWIVEDTSRSPYNQMDAYISANASSAEATGAYYVDYLSNGFKLRYADPYGDTNASGSTYIFAAFAENPFKYSLAR